MLVQVYLATSYEHDREYADGELIERAIPCRRHSLLQTLIAAHLLSYRREFQYRVMTECRVAIEEGARYRIPDILLEEIASSQDTKFVQTAPLAVIEILSPEDRMHQQIVRYREFWNRGVRLILIFDPESLTVWQYLEGALIEKKLEHLEMPDGRTIPFSSVAIFQELEAELSGQ